MKLVIVFLLGFIFCQVSAKVLLANNKYANIELKPNKCRPTDPNYRLYFWKDGDIPISPIHDINLHATTNPADETFNMIVEIPFGSRDKKEMATCETLNPIFQDVTRDENGVIKIPHVPRLAKGPYPFKYGALPQTWENSVKKDGRTGMVGDNDPLDVVEIGSNNDKFIAGSIIRVKILGVIGLVDSNETDWKLIAINVNDKDADNVSGMDSVLKNRTLCERLQLVLDWFDGYRGVKYISSSREGGIGGPELPPQYKFFGSARALDLIEETHMNWIVLSVGFYTKNDFQRTGKDEVALARIIHKFEQDNTIQLKAAKKVAGKHDKPSIFRRIRNRFR